MQEQFFPTEVQKIVRKLAKGKKPCVGDSEAWLAVSAEDAEELRRSILYLAEASAQRKLLKRAINHYSREFGEFNAHFSLSSYDKLPKAKMGDARRYLEQKLHARRSGETQQQKRKRYRGGIRAISTKLGLSDSTYRQVLRSVTGFSSLTDLSLAQLEQAFREFRKMQDAHDSDTLNETKPGRAL